MTGLWLNVDFERTAPVSGTDRLLLFVAGFDCSGADVYFDDLKVMSTNTGLVVTNRIRGGYWEGDEPADVRGLHRSARHVSPAGGADGIARTVPLHGDPGADRAAVADRGIRLGVVRQAAGVRKGSKNVIRTR